LRCGMLTLLSHIPFH